MLIRLIGLTHTHPQTLLRLRHPPRKPNNDLSTLRIQHPTSTPQRRGSEIQTGVSGEKKEGAAVFLKLRVAESRV